MLSIKDIDNFLNKFPMPTSEIVSFVSKIGGGYLDLDTAVEFCKGCGMPLTEIDGILHLKSSFETVEGATFCFVDIETNGSNPRSAQVIEIGAVKYKNGIFVESFERLIKTDYLPQNISEITGITVSDLKNGEREKDALVGFRNFLQDSVFCAHSVDFDFSFISHRMEQNGLFPLLNKRLCTFDLAKKTLKATKYGLKTLKNELSLGDDIHHRALPDAKSSALVFEAAIKNIKQKFESVEDLIIFSKTKNFEAESSL